jgi:hypothetical protein
LPKQKLFCRRAEGVASRAAQTVSREWELGSNLATHPPRKH